MEKRIRRAAVESAYMGFGAVLTVLSVMYTAIVSRTLRPFECEAGTIADDACGSLVTAGVLTIMYAVGVPLAIYSLIYLSLRVMYVKPNWGDNEEVEGIAQIAKTILEKKLMTATSLNELQELSDKRAHAKFLAVIGACNQCRTVTICAKHLRRRFEDPASLHSQRMVKPQSVCGSAWGGPMHVRGCLYAGQVVGEPST